METIQIAIDGPASSGKSTVAKIIAKDFDTITQIQVLSVSCGDLYGSQEPIRGRDENFSLINHIQSVLTKLRQLVFVGCGYYSSYPENEVTNHVSAIAAIRST